MTAMARALLALLLIATAGTPAAQAQSYPAKPVTIIIPLAAGGAVDRLTRTLIEPMKVSLG